MSQSHIPVARRTKNQGRYSKNQGIEKAKTNITNSGLRLATLLLICYSQERKWDPKLRVSNDLGINLDYSCEWNGRNISQLELYRGAAAGGIAKASIGTGKHFVVISYPTQEIVSLSLHGADNSWESV
jgi:hypothetical protein